MTTKNVVLCVIALKKEISEYGILIVERISHCTKLNSLAMQNIWFGKNSEIN